MIPVGTGSPLPPTQLTADPTALIAQDAKIVGQVSIGPGCIIHPRASLLALAGPIDLGAGCVVEELAVLVNNGGASEGVGGVTAPERSVMQVGDGNQFSVGCCESHPLTLRPLSSTAGTNV